MLKKNLLNTSTFFLNLGCQCNNSADLANTEKERNDLYDDTHAWWQLEYYIDRVLN